MCPGRGGGAAVPVHGQDDRRPRVPDRRLPRQPRPGRALHLQDPGAAQDHCPRRPGGRHGTEAQGRGQLQ